LPSEAQLSEKDYQPISAHIDHNPDLYRRKQEKIKPFNIGGDGLTSSKTVAQTDMPSGNESKSKITSAPIGVFPLF